MYTLGGVDYTIYMPGGVDYTRGRGVYYRVNDIPINRNPLGWKGVCTLSLVHIPWPIMISDTLSMLALKEFGWSYHLVISLK